MPVVAGDIYRAGPDDIFLSTVHIHLSLICVRGAGLDLPALLPEVGYRGAALFPAPSSVHIHVSLLRVRGAGLGLPALFGLLME